MPTPTTKQKNKPLIPKLRFPEFSDSWDEKKFGDFLIYEPREIPKPKNLYKGIGLRSHFRGTFQRLDSDPKKTSMKNLFQVKENDFLVNITFAWEGALAIANKEDEGGLVSHRFPTYVFNKKVTSPEYFRFVFPRDRIKYILEGISPGGAGRNRVLNKKDFLKITVFLPSLPEQQKIASFLSSVDEWVENLKKQKENLELYKKGMMQKIFSQEIRFKDENGKDFPEWEEKRLGECLDYEQPTRHIVKSTEYNDSYATPVLTAGKSFILGYTDEIDGVYKKEDLPVVIFDDFTTASQFVSFPFKVKSSAMKILKGNEETDIKFIYEAMQRIRYEVGGHGRHWISKYSQLSIETPVLQEQQKIAEFLTSLDELIELKNKKITQAESWKKGLMRGLFV
jgi:type I restriction enzyme S subunit